MQYSQHFSYLCVQHTTHVSDKRALTNHSHSSVNLWLNSIVQLGLLLIRKRNTQFNKVGKKWQVEPVDLNTRHCQPCSLGSTCKPKIHSSWLCSLFLVFAFACFPLHTYIGNYTHCYNDDVLVLTIFHGMVSQAIYGCLARDIVFLAPKKAALFHPIFGITPDDKKLFFSRQR